MSSIEQDETVLRCVEGGAEEYLVKPVTKKELQHIWQHVWRKQLASAATVPQVRPAPAAAALEAIAAEAAAEAAATAAPPTGQRPAPSAHEQPQAAAAEQSGSGAAAPSVEVPAVGIAASAGAQQQQATAPQALPLGDFIISPASLEKRLKLFGVAVTLLQSCHAHAAPLLRLRPYSLGITPQGLRVIEAPQQQQQKQQAGDVRQVLDSLYMSPEERAAAASGAAVPGGHGAGVTMAADMFSLGALFVDLFLPCASVQVRGVMPSIASWAVCT